MYDDTASTIVSGKCQTPVVEYYEMNEVIPNLWLGDLRSAQNTAKLREKNIHSVLTAMRGKVVVEEVCRYFHVQVTIL